MSKADQNAARAQAQKQISANLSNQTASDRTLQSILGTSQTTAADVLPGITGTFGALAQTGGISPADATAIRNQATQAAQSTYQTGQEAASRMAAATGGYGASGAIQADLARQGSEAASRAATAANASLVGLRQAGQIAGAQGLANIYGLNQSQISSTVDQILRNYQQTGTLNNQDLAILTNLANQPGVFDKIVQTIGTLGGAAAGVAKSVAPGGFLGRSVSGVPGYG